MKTTSILLSSSSSMQFGNHQLNYHHQEHRHYEHKIYVIRFTIYSALGCI